MIRFHDRNRGLSPLDPAYHCDYDAEAAYDEYERACEDRADRSRDDS